MVFGRDPVKLESKALQYEQRGKTAKALKYREKAARLRASRGVSPLTTIPTTYSTLGSTPLGAAAPLSYSSAPLGTTSTLGAPLGTTSTFGAPMGTTSTLGAPLGTGFTSTHNPQRYEANALKWEQRGNWAKAQKNREKVWRLQNPQYGAQYAAPSFYQNNKFLGYNVPYTGTPLQQGFQQGLPLQQGLQQGLPLQQSGLPLQQQGLSPFQKFEQSALKWEQRGNWNKAQRSRERAWRHQNPQFAQQAAPMFYQNNKFLGYNAPLTGGLAQQGLQQGFPLQQGLQQGLPLQQGLQQGLPLQQGFQQGLPLQQGGLFNKYEQSALKWEQRGNWNKAQRSRERAWRHQNPQFAQQAAPMFYQNNKFLGYNVPFTGLQGAPLQQGFGLQKQGLPLQQGAFPATMHNVLPATVERHVHPTVIQQTARPEKIVEIQPVVHREIDAPRVHIVEKHLYETVPSTGPGLITKTPIVEETVRPRIIEEIQPVVHREVPAPFVERVEQHVTERVTQPTTMTKEVINDATVRPMGMAAGGPAIPFSQTTTTTATTGGPLAGVKNTINNLTHRR